PFLVARPAAARIHVPDGLQYPSPDLPRGDVRDVQPLRPATGPQLRPDGYWKERAEAELRSLLVQSGRRSGLRCESESVGQEHHLRVDGREGVRDMQTRRRHLPAW